MKEWLTTAPNPRAPSTGFDAGQRGWRLHAVENGRAACGTVAAHGWGLDLFVDTKCKRCVRALAKTHAC